MSGWFAMKHGISKHHLFKGRPERMAIWVWLVDNAVYKDTPHDINGRTVIIPRGSVAASERFISKQTGVSYQSVRTFLARLRDEHMINAQSTHGKNVISLCNYEKYQSPPDTTNAAPNARLTHDQRTKEQDNNIPVGTDDKIAVDPTKIIFDTGREILTQSGMSKAAAGSLLGKWRKQYGDALLIAALGKAQREGAIDPAAFITGVLKHAAKSKRQSGDGQNAGAFGTLREVG